ncbi:MAG: carboxypeptidase regulatory-like domain-containing protein, partial [Pirellulales bacterium]|nr:carboxypeptidase regulatory-like domain-containing protein [Pirellulales bacterium]
MGLFRKSKNRQLRVDSAHEKSTNSKGSRVCRFETMEPRQFLAADINPITIGSVYYEDESGFDDGGDLIEITFNGGAEGTQLSQIVIDTDKLGDGATIGDTFFDLADGGEGAFNSLPVSVVSSDGIDSYSISAIDGGQLLVIDFTGFDAGEKIVLSLDVDEFGFIGANAVAEGNEWEGTTLSATFVHEDYFDATGSDIYLDAYDSKLVDTGLDLPPDNYIPPSDEPAPVRTAGAVFELEQTPLPITIAGTVFEDFNQNNQQDSGDAGIAGVQLELLRLEGDTYVPTGLTTTTDENGDYLFSDEQLTPGTYQVVETQPDGYLSVGASAGTVDGVTVGLVESVDVIAEISLVGGDDSIDNDFAEFVPASIQGRVHVDSDGDCEYDEGESLLEGVTIQLFDDQGDLVATTQTDANGEYTFDGLAPGTYTVVEQQPDGYFDGGEKAGSEGGVVTDDRIAEIVLTAGAQAINYDFCELEPSSISGRVHVDSDGDCVFDEDEPALAGVTIRLYNGEGELVATTETNASGEYSFDNLAPGTYTVVEEQPAGYFDGGEKAGSE